MRITAHYSAGEIVHVSGLIVFAVLIMGCSRSEDSPKPAGAGQPSAGQQVIDGVTGRAAVRSYLDTRETLKDIQTQQKERNQKLP